MGADYRFAPTSNINANIHADYSYSDRISTNDAFQNKLYPELYNHTRGRTLNSQIEFSSADERWSVSVWGKNLTDNFQLTQADDASVFLTTSPGTAFWRVSQNSPRTFGVTLTVRN